MEKSLLLQELPESSWPRERLLREGEKHLSDQELLAIILRNGSRQQNVMELAGSILREYPALYDLKHATLQELQQLIRITGNSFLHPGRKHHGESGNI